MTKREADRLVGRRIVAVRQTRWNVRKSYSKFVNDFVEIELDNGAAIRAIVQETDFGDYAIELIATKPKPRHEDL